MARILVSINSAPPAAGAMPPADPGVRLVVKATPSAVGMVVQSGRQGPAGPAGAAGAAGPAGPAGESATTGKSLRADPSRPVAYAGFATRILRLDYSTWPPLISSAETSSLDQDWPNRQTLDYI